jgi:hypothetical protein
MQEADLTVLALKLFNVKPEGNYLEPNGRNGKNIPSLR